MAKYVIMPKLGFNMQEGKVVQWLKKEGDKIKEQEAILKIETDKSVIDVDSQVSGILRKILVQEGEFVPVTIPIAIIAEQDEDINAMIKEGLEKLGSIDKGEKKEKQKEQEKESEEELPEKQTQYFQEKVKPESKKISPRARKKLKEIGIDLQLIKNNISKKIITEKDIIEFLKKEKIPKSQMEDHNQRDSKKVITKEVPYSGMRQMIGDRLSGSKFSAPHIYFSNSVDMSNVLGILDFFKKEKELNISINDFLIFVVTKILIEHPQLNSSFVDNRILTFSNVNIGIAVGLPDGLIVPVLKGSERKSLFEISRESKRLITLARGRKLLPDDYQDGTFTISNLGMFGIEEFTAIINPPEVAILAVGNIQKKPIVDENNQIVIKPVLKLTLSVDHRIIDGMAAALFLKKLKKYLTNPGIPGIQEY